MSSPRRDLLGARRDSMQRFLVDLTMCFGKGQVEIHGGGEYGKAAARFFASSCGQRAVLALVRSGDEESAREVLGERVDVRVTGNGPLEAVPQDLDSSDNVLFLPLPGRFLERGRACAARVVAVEHGLRAHERAYSVADHLCHPLIDGRLVRALLCGYAGALRSRRLRRVNERYRRRLSALKPGDRLVTASRHTRCALMLEFASLLRGEGTLGGDGIRVLPPLSPFLSPAAQGPAERRGGILLLSANRPIKNVERFLEGLARHTVARDAANERGIDLVGTDEDSRRRLERRFGETLRMSMHPYVSAEDLQAFIREAYVLVFPSIAEGYGIPPVDAFAQGTPVIAAASAAITEVVGGAALLADPLQPTELANRLVQLLEDPELHRRKSVEGLERYDTLRRDTLAAWDGFVRAVEG